MAKNYPSIGEYNQLILKQGGNAFKSLYNISLIPSRTTPFKYYLFGSGAFAAVFKGSLHGTNYAIRCFLTAENETIIRYKTICNHLDEIEASWKTECEFIENEISINGNSYPILKMEWLNGFLINRFVSNHLSDNSILTELQIKLISVSNDLEKHKIGHGDIQSGNIIITGPSSNFQVKLIDYDGMYVPALANKKSIEKGRSEFQHPKRTVNNFSPEMDRFSFWVMITALEALKVDKTLWREVMQGGFNTGDNFLFTIQDFLNPNQSNLFNRLYNLNSASLNYYLDKLKWFCNSEYSVVTKPSLSGQSSSSTSYIATDHQKYVPYNESKVKQITTPIPTPQIEPSISSQNNSKDDFIGKLILIVLIIGTFLIVYYALYNSSNNHLESTNNTSTVDTYIGVDTTMAVDTAQVYDDNTMAVDTVMPENSTNNIVVKATPDNNVIVSDEDYSALDVSNFFLSSLDNRKYEDAWNFTYNPKWERKGKDWFCSSQAYGGINNIELYEIIEVSNYGDEAVIFAKYYAEDIYNGNGTYSQNFILKKYDKKWLITDIRNIR